jgi:hypothetical protein
MINTHCPCCGEHWCFSPNDWECARRFSIHQETCKPVAKPVAEPVKTVPALPSSTQTSTTLTLHTAKPSYPREWYGF